MLFDIREFGAVGDGVTLNTAAIQKAIDACGESGGGRVLVAGGTFMTGTVLLKSGVELHIAVDGVLLGSPDCADYPERTVSHVNTAMLPRARNACMIFAEGCKGISVTGMGTIDCNGTSFVEKSEEPTWNGWAYHRKDLPTPPRAVFFTNCCNVKIEDVTMVNQPSGWSYWIHDCDRVIFDRCNILADVSYPNNDGIHINSSRNVTISNCNIVTGDDCIVVRANNASLREAKVCERVTVTNCNLTSYANAVRVGWINDGTIRNVTFSNLVITDSLNGITVLLPGRGETRLLDEGREDTLIERISFDNVVMDRVTNCPVLVYIADNPHTRCNAIRNLYFSNLHARSTKGFYLSGRKSNVIKNIVFSNCSFEQYEDEACKAGPSPWDSMHGNEIHYIEGLQLNNTEFFSEN